MGRKNHRPHRTQQRRYGPGEAAPRALRPMTPLPVSIEKMVLPTGRCYFRSKGGKLIFKTEAEAAAALRQANAKRRVQSNGHVECRFYACPEGGCGGFHLTSRAEFQERGKTA